MAEKSKKTRKKSKDNNSDSSDDDVTAYVAREMDRAMKEVNKAVRQANSARKQAEMAQKAAFKYRNDDAVPRGKDDARGGKGDKGGKYDYHAEGASSWSETKGNTYTQFNTVTHKGTMINIQNAKNVQVGNNNVMVVADEKLSRMRTSQARDTTEEDRQKEEEERRQREIEARFKDVLESARPATRQDFTKACTHVTNWRRFLRNLDLSDGEIETLYQDHHSLSVREVMIQGAIVWQQKSPTGATLGAFANKLNKLKQFDSIEVLKVDDKRQTTV